MQERATSVADSGFDVKLLPAQPTVKVVPESNVWPAAPADGRGTAMAMLAKTTQATSTATTDL